MVNQKNKKEDRQNDPKKNDKVDVAKAGKRSSKAIKEKAEKEKKQGVASSKKIVEKTKKSSKNVNKSHSKKYREAIKIFDKTNHYILEEAVSIIKKISNTKFDSTIEIHVNLSIDPKQADQNVRGNLVLPKSLGKKVIIAALANEKFSKQLKDAGVDLCDSEDIISGLSKSKIDFDVLIATPDQMAKIGKFAKILGPKGLMPTPKSGTVTDKPVETVKEIKKGRVEFRNDSYGIIHMAVAKASFDNKDILGNIKSVVEAIRASKPSNTKGSYIKSAYLTSTMSPSIKLDITSL